MKVLHILDHSLPVFSGYSFRSANIVRFQKSSGITPVVLTSPKHGSGENTEEEIDGIRYYRTATLASNKLVDLPLVKEQRLMSRLKGRIREVVKKERVDLIHSHSPSLNGLPAAKVAKDFGLPFVYEARAFWEDAAVDHGTFKENSLRYCLSRAVETRLFRRADAAIVIAEGMRNDLVQRRIERSSVSVIPNGVDVCEFQPRARNAEIAGRLGLNGGPVFGFVGSFYHYEGLSFFLQSFPRILAKFPHAKLLLIGGGPEEPALRSASGGCGNAVQFLGKIPHAQVPDYYSVMDVLIFPRRKMRLTELVTPLKPLEAMAMGKAVLASDVGGHCELIEHEKTGLLFHADDSKALEAEAIRIAHSASLRADLGRDGRTYVEQTRQWPDIVSRYSNIYNKLLH